MKPEYRITDAIADGLGKIERARGFLDGVKLSEGFLEEMRERAFVREAHHTTHIEGTQLTLDQSERLLAGQEVPEANPEDVQELLNYRKAFELVTTFLEGGGPITEGMVREIHRALVENVRGNAATPGEYRKVQNYVVNSQTGKVIYTPPDAFEVPRMMGELTAWIASDTGVHPILMGGIAQFELVHIHPFLDGNGRTARLLSTLCLYRSGYDFKRLFSISQYYDRDRPAYYAAIQSVRETGMDLTGWLTYFVDGLVTQLEEVQQRGTTAVKLDQLVAEGAITTRQCQILDFGLSVDSFTTANLADSFPEVSARTLQRDLKELVEKGLLAQEGATAQLRYRVVSL